MCLRIQVATQLKVPMQVRRTQPLLARHEPDCVQTQVQLQVLEVLRLTADPHQAQVDQQARREGMVSHQLKVLHPMRQWIQRCRTFPPA
jgi:hypothetical protein